MEVNERELGTQIRAIDEEMTVSMEAKSQTGMVQPGNAGLSGTAASVV
jgi:hypothetical protein